MSNEALRAVRDVRAAPTRGHEAHVEASAGPFFIEASADASFIEARAES
jgi:hypothetical protein